MERWLKGAADVLLVPPVSLIWLGLMGAGLAVSKRCRTWGTALLAGAAIGLFALSTPLVRDVCLGSLDRHPPLDPEWRQVPSAQAVVVLGAAARWGAREWGGMSVGPFTLERLRYGAEVHRRTGLPVLITGYTAAAMAGVMETSFRVPVRWTETESLDTYQNAELSARLLRREGIQRIFLVTHFWHMPRSVRVFRGAGLDPVPAPTGFLGPRPTSQPLHRLLPRPTSLQLTQAAFHEWVGLAWYRLRHG